MIPPQAYFEMVTHSGFDGSFWEIFPLYFKHIVSGADFDSPFFFRIFCGHLWFLQFLFLISFVLLPLLLFLKSEKGLRFISRLAGVCSRKGGIFLFLIPLALIRIRLTHLTDGEHTWEDFLPFECERTLPEVQIPRIDLQQRGRTSILHISSDSHTYCWLVCHSMEHRNVVKIHCSRHRILQPDHRAL